MLIITIIIYEIVCQKRALEMWAYSYNNRGISTILTWIRPPVRRTVCATLCTKLRETDSIMLLDAICRQITTRVNIHSDSSRFLSSFLYNPATVFLYTTFHSATITWKRKTDFHSKILANGSVFVYESWVSRIDSFKLNMCIIITSSHGFG